MNYHRPQLLDQLAAAYALGVLRHGARRRFERLCTENAAARDAARQWQERLLPLSLALAPIRPSAQVWPRIERRIAATAPRRARTYWWPAALAASLVAIAMMIGVLREHREPSWNTVAALAMEHKAPLWTVQRSGDTARLHIVTVGNPTLEPTKSYELWALPKSAGSPVSLGLLPRRGELVRTLSERQRQSLLSANKIAVSIEPVDGSPTGLPTGAVVIVAPIDVITKS